MRCADIMKKNPVCITEKDDAHKAAGLMRDQNLGFLPVCDPDGRPVGAVTDRDLTIRLVAEGMPAQTSISDVMTREVVACRPEDDVLEAERRMSRERKSRMFVVDGDGKLVGVISLSDIAQNETESGRTARTLKEVTNREARPSADV